MASPFSGMDPFLEDPVLWPEFHHQFVTCLYQILLPALAQRYKARVAQRTYGESQKEEYIEIKQAVDESFVTLVDIVSPANKLTTEGREAYFKTRRAAKEAGASLVEIDLVLQGQPMLDYSRETMPEWNFAVTVTRSAKPERYEVYPSTLEKRLPRIRLPLDSDDRDVVVDFQVAFSRSYDQGGFTWRLDYFHDPVAPLSDKHRVWVDELLQLHGLRPRSEEVARLAYSFWEQEGRPDGRDREHWERAREELRKSLLLLSCR